MSAVMLPTDFLQGVIIYFADVNIRKQKANKQVLNPVGEF